MIILLLFEDNLKKRFDLVCQKYIGARFFLILHALFLVFQLLWIHSFIVSSLKLNNSSNRWKKCTCVQFLGSITKFAYDPSATICKTNGCPENSWPVTLRLLMFSDKISVKLIVEWIVMQENNVLNLVAIFKPGKHWQIERISVGFENFKLPMNNIETNRICNKIGDND